jgi:hypothetical protein
MTGEFIDYELRNLQQTGPDAEWAIARLYGNVPLDMFAAYGGMAKKLERNGYEAYFKTETGLQILWARRKPAPASTATPERTEGAS